MQNIIERLYSRQEAEKDELVYLLEHLNRQSQELLFGYANLRRTEYYDDRVYMRGLIEFSNFCRCNCRYCGIRRDNLTVQRYRLSPDEILACCLEGDRLGYKTFVLQSGEDSYYTDEILVELIKEIKRYLPASAITLSLGERSYTSYFRLFQAGAERYLLRHETASEELYNRIHPDMDFYNRRKCLSELKEIGYQVGAGFMVGLPGQTNADLAEDLLYLVKLQPQMVGIGPFIPHPQTPLGGYQGGTVEKTCIMLALTRLLLPKALLPATTAMGSLDSLGREKALKAGANVVMPNLSPVAVRSKYELYKGKICLGDEAAHCRNCIERRIEQAGFKVDIERGDHCEWRKDSNVY